MLTENPSDGLLDGSTPECPKRDLLKALLQEAIGSGCILEVLGDPGEELAPIGPLLGVARWSRREVRWGPAPFNRAIEDC